MKLRVYSNSAFLLRAAIGISRRVTSAGGRLLFFQSVFNLLPHIMHLFPSDRPPSILFAKKFRIHDSFIATPPQKMRGTLRVVTVADSGTGQGSVISPLLGNIYLHYVFDLWAERWRRQEARGDMIVVRYADDLVVGFEHEGDARRFLDAMHDRLGEFALSLHPDKTRLIEFGRFAANDRKLRGLGKPETFAFLGFTFICGRSRRGNFQLQRKTRRDRMRRKLGDIKAELLRRMHQPIPEQGKWLRQVVAGHFAYYAVPTNSRALSAFRHYVTDLWRRTLRRRSQKDGFTWERMTKLVADWLPPPRILHPWPDERFDVRHPR